MRSNARVRQEQELDRRHNRRVLTIIVIAGLTRWVADLVAQAAHGVHGYSQQGVSASAAHSDPMAA